MTRMRRSVFVVALSMQIAAGCKFLNKSATEDAGIVSTEDASSTTVASNDAAPAPTGTGPAPDGPAAVTTSERAANEDDVARFSNEAKLDHVPATVLAASANVRLSPPFGAVFSTLKKGTEVKQIAQRDKYFLITFQDPKDATRKMMGWTHTDSFTATAVLDAGVNQISITCPGNQQPLISDNAMFCGVVCKVDKECPVNHACKGSALLLGKDKKTSSVQTCAAIHVPTVVDAGAARGMVDAALPKADAASPKTDAAAPATERAAFGRGGMKGPFRKGGSVRATNLNVPSQSEQTMFLDDDGHYALVVPWTGPTLLEARGPFLDEFTGALASLDEALAAVANAESGKPLACSINILTTVSAAMLRNGKTAVAHEITEAEVDDTNQRVAYAILSEPGLDVSKIDLGDRSPTSARALQFHLAVAATAGNARVVKAAGQFGVEIASHAQLGSFAGDVVTASTLAAAMNELRAGRTITVTTATGAKIQVPVAEVLKRIPQTSVPRL
jgi:hypothetical protein